MVTAAYSQRALLCGREAVMEDQYDLTGRSTVQSARAISSITTATEAS